VVNTFNHRLLIHEPGTWRSLHFNNRNTVADGSSTPARVCTPSVSRPERGPGDDHDDRGHDQQTDEDGMEKLGLSGLPVHGVAYAEDVADQEARAKMQISMCPASGRLNARHGGSGPPESGAAWPGHECRPVGGS